MKTRTSVSKESDLLLPSKKDTLDNTDVSSLAEEAGSSHVNVHQSKIEKNNSYPRRNRKHSREKLKNNSSSNPFNLVKNIKHNATEFSGEDSDSNNINLQNNCTSYKKTTEDKKGRNLDRVVRRMLKAKKEITDPAISCKGDEIVSNTADIKTLASGADGKFSLARLHEEAAENIDINKGMIDVQLAVENHLSKSGVIDRASENENIGTHHNGDSSPCSSPGHSPAVNSLNSDNETTCRRPFVQSSSVIVTDSERNTKMSPIIKQEPVSAMNSRMAMYHGNGPIETHSPPSSYGSHPSPEQRSPSPSSPGGRNAVALPSPPELIMNPSMQHLTTTAMLAANGNLNAFHSSILPPRSSAYSRHSPQNSSPRYSDEMRSSGVTAAAMAASGIGLPTLVPTISAIPQNAPPMFHIGQNGIARSAMSHFGDSTYTQARRNESDVGGLKVSPNAPSGPNPPRGIVGQKAAQESRTGRRGHNVDEKCAYKRPPHTYPALIASAILDSPGNLITLRGIYDYIMNNFPYYKFGHDKSAWQNSIRHNLSLNQCFVKVPRYENAAKSNYWTMTREGFEEFGNENSFKRRRRRGAALAPISAYKNKKYNDASGRNAKVRNGIRENSPLRNGLKPQSTPIDFQRWGGRSRTPEPAVGYNLTREGHAITKAMKRAASPSGIGGKHPRMLVLKQGEGPALDGFSRGGDHPQRPNSLSSVEEMQGNLNSFSKTLSGTTENASETSRSPRHGQGRGSPNSKHPASHQAWMMAAAQKNLGLFPPGLIPNLSASPSDRFSLANSEAQAKIRSLGINGNPVMHENIEIGSQTPLYLENSSIPSWTFSCRFCDYTFVDESSIMLEKHCQLSHQYELTNAKAKAVAAAVGGHQKELDVRNKSPNSVQDTAAGLMSLQNMVPGFSPSMLAAAAGYKNAQNILAAAQAAGINLPGSTAYPSSMTMSNPTTSSASYFSDPIMQSIAQQMSVGNSDEAPNATDSLQRQQLMAINNAIQHAAMNNAAGHSSATQEQIRQILYQQLLMQNSFFSGNSSLPSGIQRPIPGARNDMSSLAQIWQYQQKMFEMGLQNNNEKTTNESAIRQSPKRDRKGSSSSVSSQQHGQAGDAADNDKQDDIHGWKQCRKCDFTAKGSHGLELHYRKAHVNEDREQRNSESQAENIEEKKNKDNLNKNEFASTQLTKEAKDVASYGNATSGTQTESDEDRRTCTHCDVTFGDDTMHALHMSCHDRIDPFKCTICGKECHEKYYFNVHLLRGLHQSPPNKSKKPLPDEGAPQEALERRHSKSSERSFSSTGTDISERVEIDDSVTVPRVDVTAHDVTGDFTTHA